MPKERNAQHGRQRGRRRRRWPWITALCILVVLIAVGGVVAVFASQAMSVKDDLLTAKSELQMIPAAVQKRDSSQIDASAQKVLRLTKRAEQTVQGPLWDLAAKIPFVDRNVVAVRKAAEATNTLAEGALPPGVKLMSTLDLKTLALKGGGVDLAPIRAAGAALPEITAAFDKAQQQLKGIDRSKLLPEVNDAIGSLFTIMDDAGPALKNIQHYLPTILDALGGNGKRTYMLMFQNNAEIRSGGGLPASTVIMQVDNGSVKLVAQTASGSFPTDRLVIDLPPETMQLYDADTFRGFGNFTRTPNFPYTANAYASLWHINRGSKLDGVISVDPVVLAHILSVTGPITTADGHTLTSANVVKAVLHDVYVQYDDPGQTAFFGDVAARAFDKIAAGKWDPVKMLKALEQSVSEQRLHLWFARPNEQKMAVELGLDGAMPTSNEKVTTVGIFLNDYAASKLEYFLKSKVDVTCNPEERTVTTSVTVTNSAPKQGLTRYQLGLRNRRYGVPRTTFILDVMYFAPPGGKIIQLNPARGDSQLGARSGVENGRNVQVIRVFVGSGQTRTFSYTSSLPAGKLGPLSVRYSPTVTTTPVSIAKSCEAATGTQP